MPFVEVNGARVHCLFDDPPGPTRAPILVFSNSLGTNFSMWDPQIPALSAHFRILRYDTRGHGQTSVTPGPYTITQLGRDVVALLDAFNIGRAHFCGLSMGGGIGMWLGIFAADRIKRLVLCDTAAKIGTTDVWNTRIEIVRKGGTAAVVDGLTQRWFSPAFISSAPDQVERTRQMILSTSPEGYMANCAAIRDMDQRETISRIPVPTLVIAGTKDPVTTPADARFIVERIPGARYAELDAAHLSNIEAPGPFTETLLQFLTQPEAK
ncbi:MAG: 3-oxoadipate enol-lactonase [Candidatus Acidiferrales bacterium]